MSGQTGMVRPFAADGGPLGPIRVLLVEDNSGDADLVGEFLLETATITHVSTLAEAVRLTQAKVFDACLLDASLPDAEGAEGVRVLATHISFPLILLTGTDSPELWRLAAQLGAQDYLVKGQVNARGLVRALYSAIERHESAVQFRTLLESSPDGVLLVDKKRLIRYANPAALNSFGMSQEELVGSPLAIPIQHADGRELTLRNGRVVELRVADVPWRGAKASLVMLRDVTERIHLLRTKEELVARLGDANRQLEALATVDPLTGVLNRRGLEARLLQILKQAERDGSQVAAILVDCDDFKEINRNTGYAGGDAALKMIANLLFNGVRTPVDAVGRTGGDEFLVLMPMCTPAAALLVAERLCASAHALSLPLAGTGREAGLSISLGVTEVPKDAGCLQEVIALAEGSLMTSKRLGKDRASVEGAEALEFSREVQKVLTTPGALRVLAQPIVRMSDCAVIGYEALIRGPQGSSLESPDALFGAAIRCGMLTAMDLLCLRACVAVASKLAKPFPLHLNCFPSTILDTPIETLLTILAPGSKCPLVLELSEQQFVGDPSLLLAHCSQLRQAGVALALDDVGFGRSSLEALIVLTPEFVKIDRSLVCGVAERSQLRSSLDRLLKCLSGLRSQVIAEGIEVEADAAVIAGMGVVTGQGYLFGRPAGLPMANAN